MGQAMYLMKYPDSSGRIFYDSMPDSLFWPVFVIATIAAMIASQAMISATFPCVKLAMAVGCFPRLKIIHTSRRLMRQIYIPVINWFLMITCVVVVSIFRSTTDITNAYGATFLTSTPIYLFLLLSFLKMCLFGLFKIF